MLSLGPGLTGDRYQGQDTQASALPSQLRGPEAQQLGLLG